MATGYSSIAVAEARERLQNVLKGIDGVIKLQKQAKDNEQYNLDSSALYVAARQYLLALAKDFDIFKKYVLDNKDKLYDKEPEYYAYMADNIQMQIDNFQDTIIIPTLTSPIPAGSSANDTEVGASFEGKIILVPDGDTVVVEQKLTPDSVPTKHSIRLAGIDSPESGTSRGKMVAKATEDFWKGKDVTVFYDRHTPNDLYGRVLGTIYWNDINFAIWSLEHCYTEPNLKFGKNHYVDSAEIKQAFKKCLVGWPEIGTIKVTSKPPHASIHLGRTDSEFSINRGNTPNEVDLPIGKYTIILSLPEYSSIRDEIEITAEKRQLPLYVLSKSSTSVGTVSIVTSPFDSKAIISINDVIIGLSPIVVDLPLLPPSRISVVADGYDVSEISVSPVLGEITRIVVPLKKS